MDTATMSALSTAITIVGFIATIASLVLAVGAIWLSFIFYKMSNEASKETTTAAKNIQASVDRLENLFDKLYSDTFSMMKDTVTDMRHHIWRKPDVSPENKVINDEDKLLELKSNISKEIIGMVDEKFKNIGENNGKIKELEESIKDLLETKLDKSLKLNNSSKLKVVPSEIQKRRLLKIIENHVSISVEKLLEQMNKIYGTANNKLMMELFDLREKNKITWDGPSHEVSTSNIITFIDNQSQDNEDN